MKQAVLCHLFGTVYVLHLYETGCAVSLVLNRLCFVTYLEQAVFCTYMKQAVLCHVFETGCGSRSHLLRRHRAVSAAALDATKTACPVGL